MKAILYAAEKTGGEAIYIDSVNVSDRPGTTSVQLAEKPHGPKAQTSLSSTPMT